MKWRREREKHTHCLQVDLVYLSPNLFARFLFSSSSRYSFPPPPLFIFFFSTAVTSSCSALLVSFCPLLSNCRVNELLAMALTSLHGYKTHFRCVCVCVCECVFHSSYACECKCMLTGVYGPVFTKVAVHLYKSPSLGKDEKRNKST